MSGTGVRRGGPKGKRAPASLSGGLIRGRFARARLPEVEAFTASLPFDRRLYRQDVRGSIAHARMLARVGLISGAEQRAMAAALCAIEDEIAKGRFVFRLADEDIHMAIERRLIEKTGAAGQKLHTGRSRNDQVALDLRLYLREELGEIIELLRALRLCLLRLAQQHVETVMPGYTHLQRAQPVSLAHHLLAYVEMFDRDRQRFAQALERTDVMPLGAGALAATTLPINRRMVARELGFRALCQNSLDAVSDRDFALDFLYAAALTGVHLSRMAEELILWSSSEFGFVALPDEFSTGSSMMPQKKNPDLLELFRAKSGRLAGNLVALLTVLKGLPLAYNSDLQEDKERVFDAVDTLKPMLRLAARLWPRLAFDRRALASAAGGWTVATDLAEHLVRRGTPLRRAHEIVARMVREAASGAKAPEAPMPEQLRRWSQALGIDARRLLSPARSLRARKVLGGPAPALVRRRIGELLRRQ